MTDIRITKAKNSKGRISLEYETSGSDGNPDEYAFNCADSALPEFYAALEALADHVVEMCELPTEYTERITVSGVSFSYGGDDSVMGATIIARMRLENSLVALNVNTPHKIAAFYSEEGDPRQLLSPDCIRCLQTLALEVERYINGERAQAKMFGEAA